MTLRASQRAVQLMAEIAGGQPAPETFCAGEPPVQSREITLRRDRCDRLLGVRIASQRIEGILHGFGLENSDGDSWRTPSHRPDLQREVDLIEEIVRAYGIDKIPSSTHSRFTKQSEADRVADSLGVLRQRLVARGLFEARTSALIPRAVAEQDGAVALRNPLSEDHVALRPSVVRGLLEVLARNVSMGATSIRLFELGNIFVAPDANEKRAVGLVFSGAAASAPHWRASDKRQLDFFDLKGAIDAIRIPNLAFRRAENAGLALAAEILSGDQVIGLAGQLTAPRASQFGASAPIFVAQILLDFLASGLGMGAHFAHIDKFPAVTRDVAMIVPATLTHGEVMGVITGSKEPLLADVQLFDLFAGKEGSSVEIGRKSLAYTLTYRDRNRTLTNDEVTVVHDRIRSRLKSELGAELRE
ncbi:MAG: hypothetical protein ABR589_12260 [Chthoniobacterales bacterium]